jgi:hypothetical protein
MRRVLSVEMVWHYEPRDFFEIPARFTLVVGALEVASGQATLIVPVEDEPDARSLLDQATGEVEGVFDARSLVAGKAYGLDHKRYCTVDDQGGRGTTIFPDTIVTPMEVFSPTIVTVDAAGRTITDPNAERRVAELEYVQMLADKRRTSRLVDRMVASYRRSLEDPDNALVHLYEVRDAVVQHYGSGATAQTRLGIPATDWSRFGKLANDEPIREGRHRGKSGQPLRPATKAELAEARGFAKRLIDAAAAVT